MELQFEQESREIWRESFQKSESFLVELEGVVPDVSEDVGRVAAVQCSVLLKSKELVGQSLRVGGEVEAVVLTITENADAIDAVRLTKEFEQEIALGDTKVEEAQATLCVARCEGRMLNPRKLAVSAQLVCDCQGYERAGVTLSLLPGGDAASLLLGKAEQETAQAVTKVTEKTFALTESFVFPEGRSAPKEILCHALRFRLAEQSRIGTRLIVKGTMELEVSYSAEGVPYPLTQRFSSPVSQILDLGTDDARCCTVSCVPTAVYLTLNDSISGEKALEAEVHALLQAVCRSTVEVHYLSDAFSNLMPVRLYYQTLRAETGGEMERSLCTASELVPVGEDCADVLAVFPTLSGEREAQLDILYRSKNGDIASARRTLALKGEKLPGDARLLSAALMETKLSCEGEGLQCDMKAELMWQRFGVKELQAIESAELDEEHPYDLTSLPAVTLVRVEGESLWELARSYHSSPDAIEAINETGNMQGKMLLIPRK